jgi:predicted glycogen debranching enzyme
MNSADTSAYRWSWSGPTSDADLPALLGREWLESNGLGGFASGSVAGANTRRYHALLLAATTPPVGRVALVSKLDETVIDDGRRTELATNLFSGGAVHPHGFRRLESFQSFPAPTWRFRCDRCSIEKSIGMIHGRNLTIVRYAVSDDGPPVDLEVRAFVTGRDYHSITKANDSVNAHPRIMHGLVYLPLHDGLPAVWFGHNAIEFRDERTWYYNFDYPRERERGLECCEDLLSAGVFHFRLRPGKPAWLAVGTDPVSAEDAAHLFDRELRSRETWPLSNDAHPLVAELGRATSAFISRRGAEHQTVIAGYPWFTDWGRDTFISLPGLCLVTGRYDVARKILLAFADYVDQGMIPNVFGDSSGAEFNTIDASLWYVAAVHRYVAYTHDVEVLRQGLLDVILSIIDWHERGTRYNIRVDSDGLVAGGADGVQLTWMDAKVGGHVVTPRRGKPVEISALWYNALLAAAELCELAGRPAAVKPLVAQAKLARTSFNAKFWNASAGCLYDVLTDSGPDASLRPNQLFAISLPFPVLDAAKQAAVVDAVERRLLTPWGLRTLDRDDSQFRPRFEGGPWERDHAYHQGTVWPWLLGPFVTAYIRSRGDSAEARQRMQQLLEAWGNHLTEAGLGSICEVSDGDPPHRPAGCYFQAWSVAEPLRAFCEDVLGRRPKPLN